MYLIRKVNWLFQRGVLTILEVAGIALMIRALVAPTINIEAAALGGVLLTVGAVFEYLTWRTTVFLLSPRLDDVREENARLVAQRDRLLNTLLEAAPKGAFGDHNNS
jgi:hypothetical protein